MTHIGFLLSACTFFVLSTTARLSADEEPERLKRMVFFDVQVDSAAGGLQNSSRLLTKVLGGELVKVQGIEVLDQGTRDSLIIQRKLRLEDCSKAECRFAIAKALPGIDYMLESEVEVTNDVCLVGIQAKSLRNGVLLSSASSKSACTVEGVSKAIESLAIEIWPPREIIPGARAGEVGKLLVTSIPDGVEISVDNVPRGVAPRLYTDVSVGSHTVVLSGPGLMTVTEKVVVQKGVTTELRKRVLQETGKLTINFNPPNAGLYINGVKQAGVNGRFTAVDLPVGVRSIEVTHPDFSDYRTDVKISVNQPTNLNVILKPKPGSLFVKSAPSGASVFLNGKLQYGRTPQSLELPAGRYEILLRREGHDDALQSAEIFPNQTTELNLALDREATLSKKVLRISSYVLLGAGGALAGYGYTTASGARDNYAKPGLLQRDYVNHLEDVKKGNQKTYIGGGVAAVGLTLFGVTFALD